MPIFQPLMSIWGPSPMERPTFPTMIRSLPEIDVQCNVSEKECEDSNDEPKDGEDGSG